MRRFGVLHATLFLLWRIVAGRPISADDLQEWIHERGYCIDPKCDFLATDRGARFGKGLL
jgi:hypothetical protein